MTGKIDIRLTKVVPDNEIEKLLTKCRILDCDNPVEAKRFCKEHLADPERWKMKFKPLDQKSKTEEQKK
jgi:hypothetical protein